LKQTEENHQGSAATAPTQTSRFLGGAGWLLIGNVASRFSHLVASVVIARLLGKVGFGELGIIMSTVVTAGMFAGLGIGSTATKYVAEYWSDRPQKAGRIVGLSVAVCLVSSLLMALLLLIFADVLAANMLNAPRLAGVIRLSSLLLICSAMSGPVIGALQGLEGFKCVTRATVIAGILHLPIALVLVWFFGLSGAIITNTVSAGVIWLLAAKYLKIEMAKRDLAITFKNLGKELSVLWRFSVPAFLSGIMVSPVLWIANTIIAHQENGYSELGLINAANQWRSMLILLPQVFAITALPILSMAQATDDGRDDFQNGIDLMQRLTTFLVIPLFVFIFFLSEWIMRLYGEDFAGGAMVLGVIALGVCFQILGGTIVGTAIAARGRMWLGFLINLIWGVILISIVYALASAGYGAQGYAIGYSIAYAVLLVIGYWLMRKEILRKTITRVVYTVMLLVVLGGIGAVLPSVWRAIVALPLCAAGAFIGLRLIGFKSVKEIYPRIIKALRPESRAS